MSMANPVRLKQKKYTFVFVRLHRFCGASNSRFFDNNNHHHRRRRRRGRHCHHDILIVIIVMIMIKLISVARFLDTYFENIRPLFQNRHGGLVVKASGS